MKDNGDFIFTTSQHLVEASISKFNIPLVNNNDILLSFKLTLGRIGIATCDMVTNEAIACFKVDDVYRPYLFCFLSNYNFESKMESTSSIGKAFNSTLLKSVDFLYPSYQNLCNFNSIVSPLMDRVRILREKQIKLQKIKKDLLLKYF